MTKPELLEALIKFLGLYQLVQAVMHLPAVIGVIMHPESWMNLMVAFLPGPVIGVVLILLAKRIARLLA